MIRRPPRSTRTDTLFPYTTLFRSLRIDSIDFDLRPTIAGVVALLQPRAEENNDRIRTTVADTVPEHLIGDPLRLRQILSNLLGNAIQFTENGSIELEVTAKPPADDRFLPH